MSQITNAGRVNMTCPFSLSIFLRIGQSQRKELQSLAVDHPVSRTDDQDGHVGGYGIQYCLVKPVQRFFALRFHGKNY